MNAALADIKRAAQKLGTDEKTTIGGQAEARPVIMPMEIVCGTFWPLLLFIFIFRVQLTAWRHYFYLEVMILTVLIPVAVNAWYSKKMYTAFRRGAFVRRWKFVMNIVLWPVIIFAFLQADKAYWRFMGSYYDFQSMASYVNLDPSSDRGQTYMDAGQVYFKEGTKVEVSKAIAFQEDEIYCVAPIVQQTLDSGGGEGGGGAAQENQKNSPTGSALSLPKSGTVDFWAVGINCCDPSGLNFHCGDSLNNLARAGIRELRDDTRPFFLMAVQEWTAWLKIPAKHPLFFHWVQDPLVSVDNFYFDAMKMFAFDCLKCFLGVLAGTVVLHFVLYNLGV